jgi:hypothetical protein
MDRIVALSASRWRAICKQLVCGLMSGFEARRLLLHISVSSPGWLSGYRLYLPLIERSWVRFWSATLSGSDTRSRCQRFESPWRFGWREGCGP